MSKRRDRGHSDGGAGRSLFPPKLSTGRSLFRTVVLSWLILGLFLSLAGLESAAKAQDDKSESRETVASETIVATVDSKIEEIKRRLAAAEASVNEGTAQKLGLTLAELERHAASFREVESVYQRLLTALKKSRTLEETEALLRKKVQSQEQVTPSQKPPYSLNFYDNLLDQLAVAEQNREATTVAKSFAKSALEDARLRLDKAQKVVRGIREEMATEGPERPPRLDWELEQAQLELETAQAIHDLQEITVQNLTIEIQIAALQVDISQQHIEWVRNHLHLDKADQEKQLDTLEQARSELQQRRERMIREQTRAEAAWLEAQKRVENGKREEDVTLATAALAASEARREVSQRLLEQTEDMLQLLNHQAESWKRRYALLEGEVDAQQLDAWWKELEARKMNIERALRFQETSQTRLQSQITALEKQLADQATEARLRRELKSRLGALRTLADGSLDYLGTLLATGLLQQRLLDEIAAKRKHLDLRDQLEKLESKVRNIWNFELWVIDEHGVTVRKLVVALMILIIGLLFIRSVILFTARRLLPRTHLKTTTAAAVEKMVNYAAILLIVLFALRIVNIPLTVFAFLGGAIAIGLGFGAQNLINNFISGFIIMAEQPIKIGDLIEMEGTFAMVEEIGARCTRIRTGANVHILVPNSSFLEKNIINWTLSDKMVRAQITAGVIYGSPVREVERFMLQAADEHSRVLKRPEPFVLFNDFGDNALIFELYFWISMNRLMEQRIIESDIRFHIDALFREAGIVIAFPQRDVHLDTQRPLELRIVDAESRSDEEEG